MLIRLFTSGKHNGLDFSNDDISSIAEKSAKTSPERIPIVLGHPKNDLPVVGWLPKSAIKSYSEGDKFSLGFERSDADLSEPSLEVIRKNGANKISVRLKDGAISHIGLVEKAAVDENNSQNFNAEDVTFNGTADFDVSPETDASGEAFSAVKAFFEGVRNMFTKQAGNGKQGETKEFGMSAEMTAKIADMEALLEKAARANEQNANKLKYTQQFSAKEYKLNADLLDKAATIASKLSNSDAQVFAEILKAASKPAVPGNGSVTSQFFASGSNDAETDTLNVEIGNQINSL